MTLTTRADLFTSNSSTTGWSTCEGQKEPGIEDVIWSAIMENDELGRTWGPSEGVMRVRQAILSGWNADVAAQLTVPTLIIRGEFDTGVLEFGAGLAVVAVLHADALLVVLVQPSTNVGALLYDLRRHRSAIAGLL